MIWLVEVMIEADGETARDAQRRVLETLDRVDGLRGASVIGATLLDRHEDPYSGYEVDD